MPRTWHYWKKAGPATAPSNIIVVDAETWHGKRTAVPGGELHRFRLGVVLCYRLEHSERTRCQLLRFTDPAEFWRLAESRLDERRPLWIFAHNASYDLPALDGWRVILGEDFVADEAIITPSTFYLRGMLHDKPVIFSDTTNYYHCSLESVGKAVGRQKSEMPDQDAPDRDWFAYCQNDVEVTADGLDALIGFHRENELGPWGVSIASLAFNAFRSRFMRHQILAHCDGNALVLERNAYCGGIVDTPFIGRVPFSPVHELDVNSMYGWACTQELPYRLIPTKRTPTPRTILDTEPGCQWIAEVTIDHDTLRFPVKTKRGTVYPVGRYRTTLAYPELLQAIRAGAVKWVHSAALYRSGRIFTDYMQYFSDKKNEYDLYGNTAFRTLAKYFITNLYGKTGQQSPGWLRWGEDSIRLRELELDLRPGELEYLIDHPPDRGRFENWPHWDEFMNMHEVRNWFGFIELKVGKHESRDSCPAIAATVTSHARIKLREYQDIAGQGNWCYSDTDSIWCSDTGLQRLNNLGRVVAGRLGELDYKKSYDWMSVFGPKDYQTPDMVKCKGLKPLWPDYLQDGDIAIPVRHGDEKHFLIRTAEGEYRQTQFPSALSQLREQKLSGVHVKHLVKRLHRQQTKCVVLPDGWTRPLKFPEEMP